MSIGDQVQAYVEALLPLVGTALVFEAVDALVARDAASRWWGEEQ